MALFDHRSRQAARALRKNGRLARIALLAAALRLRYWCFQDSFGRRFLWINLFLIPLFFPLPRFAAPFSATPGLFPHWANAIALVALAALALTFARVFHLYRKNSPLSPAKQEIEDRIFRLSAQARAADEARILREEIAVDPVGAVSAAAPETVDPSPLQIPRKIRRL